MARERPELDDRSTDGVDHGIDGSQSLGRRRYLKLASAAGAAAVGFSATGSASAEAAYETISVSAGDHRVIRLDDGETFENALIDVTANGASVTIDAHASDTTIRNVGIEGQLDDPPTGTIGVSETGGGTSRVENVYLGDGASSGHRHGLGLWVSPEHDGHLEIDRVNIQEMGDNSFYCSAPKGNGTVSLSNCYSANSWVAHYRLAQGTVENCVALNDDRHKNGRGVWAWSPGTVEVRDCDLAMNGRHYAIAAGANGDSCRVDVVDTRYDTGFHSGLQRRAGSTISIDEASGTDPDGSRIPDGCPTSAKEAAAGSTAADDEPSAGGWWGGRDRWQF